VWTGDPGRPRAGAVAVVGERIAAVGSAAELEAWTGPDTRLIDAGDGLVAPGFHDGHVHFLQGGFQLARVDLRDADDPEAFARRIADHAAGLGPGAWILGGDWDEQRWPGAPLPRREWIDRVTPENPVLVTRMDQHMALANSEALRLAGLSDASSAPAGGTLVRDGEGRLTGLLKDNAMDAVRRVVPDPSPEEADAALERAMGWAARHGVTSVSAVCVSPLELEAMERARERGSMRTRIAAYPMLDRWRWIADYRESHPGDAWLRVPGGKAFVDGSLGSGTALFFEPYEDAPGETGLLVTPEEDLRDWIAGADAAGLQTAVHAIGDRAVALLLGLYEEVAAENGPRDRRFRIEHAQHLRRQDVPRFARLGVVASVQPYHAADDGRWAERRVGPERLETTYAFRSLLDAGARVAFGSDWTVAPLDPIAGIRAAVTRRTLDGEHPDGWIPAQKVSLDEALRCYTREPAYMVHAEDELGTIRPGLQADLVVLDRDPFEVIPEALDGVRVRTTVVGGEVVHPSHGGAT